MTAAPDARTIAAVGAAALFAFGMLAPAHVLAWFMTEYPGAFALALVCAVAGLAAAVLLARLLLRGASRRLVFLLFALELAVALVAAVSFVSGGVTWSRFGWTVWGAVPIPLADLRVGPSGLPWFRDKTHLVTRDEVESLAAEGARVIVIGTGWDGVLRVEEAARDVPGVTLRVLPTPAAFAEYERLRARGEAVALLAHTTC